MSSIFEKTTPRPWQANFAHWGRSDITHPCSAMEWDGNLRINGQMHLYVAKDLAPGDAELIVKAVNAYQQCPQELK